MSVVPSWENLLEGTAAFSQKDGPAVALGLRTERGVGREALQMVALCPVGMASALPFASFPHALLENLGDPQMALGPISLVPTTCVQPPH